MPNAISVKEFELMGSISPHLIPITRKEQGEMKLIGTGIYVKKNGIPFLLTANHVLSGDAQKDIFVPWKEGLFVNIPALRTIVISHPEADLSISRLKEESPLYTPASPNWKDCSQIGAEILLAGFPISRSKSFDGTLKYEARFIKTWTIENAGRFSVFNEMTNVVCDFHQKKILFGGGVIGNFPNPWGMSGGGAFELTRYSSGEIGYDLVGVITDWNEKKKEFMRCTKIGLASKAIEVLMEN